MRKPAGENGAEKPNTDIIDGVQWVIGQGLVDPDNLHIFGASFGGYSALQSAVLEPDLFKTATGYVGVYDLPLLFGKGDNTHRAMGRGLSQQDAW